MKPPFPIRNPAQRGMVLIEVIIALTVFTLVAFSLVMTLNTAMDSAKERNEIGAATRGLENQIALLHAANVFPVDKDLPDDHSGITYHLVIEQEQLLNEKKENIPGIFRATITAKWISGHQQMDRSVSELLYQP